MHAYRDLGVAFNCRRHFGAMYHRTGGPGVNLRENQRYITFPDRPRGFLSRRRKSRGRHCNRDASCKTGTLRVTHATEKIRRRIRVLFLWMHSGERRKEIQVPSRHSEISRVGFVRKAPYILPRIYLRLFSPPPTRSFQCVSADVKYGDCRLFLVDRTASYRSTMLALTLECLDELRKGDLLSL